MGLTVQKYSDALVVGNFSSPYLSTTFLEHLADPSSSYHYIMSLVDEVGPTLEVETPSSDEGTPTDGPRGLKRPKRSSHERQRCVNACNRCKVKKMKCYRSEPQMSMCVACAKASAECVFDDSNRHAVSARYLMTLESRVAKLEAALAEVDPHHPEIKDRYNITRPGPNARNAISNASSSDDALAFIPQLLASCQRRKHFHPADLGAVIQPNATKPLPINSSPALPPSSVADALFDALYYHVQARYPFPDWSRLRDYHLRRQQVCQAGEAADIDDRIGAFFIWMVYAIGVELDPGLSGLDTAQSYFEQAYKHLDAVMVSYDLVTIEALLFVVFYAFRSTTGPSLWIFGGLAMRMCVDMRLHRSNTTLEEPWANERRKRLFWSAYAFDRLISHASGRPVSIADNEINVEMPIDVDSGLRDSTTILAAASTPRPSSSPLTDMASAIHSIELYRLRSRVHTTLYALDAGAPSREDTVLFLSQLEQWRHRIPRTLPSSPNVPMQQEARFHMRYFQCVLFTLRPAVICETPSDPSLTLCAIAAAEACELDRRVYQTPAGRQTTVSVCHSFICGMTLLYCLSLSPNVMSPQLSTRAVRACCTTLAVFAQLFPVAVPFYELFEYFADEILNESCSESQPSPCANAIKQLLRGHSGPLTAIYDNLILKGKTTSSDLLPSQTVPFDMPNRQQDSAAPSTGLTPFLAAPNHAPADFDFAHSDITSLLNFSLDVPDLGWPDTDYGLW
nr:fungal-specific transcription factor domain [Naematelia aurantialba]